MNQTLDNPTMTESKISPVEFTVLIALLMSIIAISIDAMLPALGIIQTDLNIISRNHVQLIISALFLGMSLGQLICGPLSDAMGRKTVLYFGVGLYFVGSVICYQAQDLTVMLIGRSLQGLGVSGPYVSAMSIVRDKYVGRQMAKTMSFVMLIFMAVPAIAPSLGQAILFFANWRAIFGMYIIYALIISIWIFFRLEETLPKEKRIAFSAPAFLGGFRQVLTHRITMSYTVCMGLFFGSFIGYLNSCQQIFQVQFNTGKMFSVYFGCLALVLAAASLTNSFFVEKLGMHKICRMSITTLVISSIAFLGLHQLTEIHLWMFLIYISILFFCCGLLFGNLNAIAMEPMGHIAGIAAAIMGATSSMISLTLGTFIGQLYNNTLIPMTTGFLILGALALWIMHWADGNKRHS